MSITVTWYVEDGYVGGSRPQTLRIDPDDFDEDATEDDVRDEIYQMISEDFAQKITYYADVDSAVAEVMSNRANPKPDHSPE